MFRTRRRAVGDVDRLQELAWTLRSEGRYADALEHAQRSLRLAENRADPRTRAAVLCTVARAHVDVGRHGAAQLFYEQASDQLDGGDDDAEVAPLRVRALVGTATCQ